MQYAELEIGLYGSQSGGYEVELRFSAPENTAPSARVEDPRSWLRELGGK